jgi:hypothetical protein
VQCLLLHSDKRLGKCCAKENMQRNLFVWNCFFSKLHKFNNLLTTLKRQSMSPTLNTKLNAKYKLAH